MLGKVFIWYSLRFKVNKGPGINFGGLWQGFFPEGSPAAYLARRMYVHVVFPPLIDRQNRQSPIDSVQRMRSSLASYSAVPRETNVTQINAHRAIRIAAQPTQGLCASISVFGWG